MWSTMWPLLSVKRGMSHAMSAVEKTVSTAVFLWREMLMTTSSVSMVGLMLLETPPLIAGKPLSVRLCHEVIMPSVTVQPGLTTKCYFLPRYTFVHAPSCQGLTMQGNSHYMLKDKPFISDGFLNIILR